jgi:hypothetical protein
MKKAQALICDNDCEICEGKGYIVTGMASKFDARNMELVDYDIKEKCPNAENEDKDE